jgi:hypothetical protein
MQSVLSVEKRGDERRFTGDFNPTFYLSQQLPATTKKRHLGIKAQIRAKKERERWIGVSVISAFIPLILASSTSPSHS